MCSNTSRRHDVTVNKGFSGHAQGDQDVIHSDTAVNTALWVSGAGGFARPVRSQVSLPRSPGVCETQYGAGNPRGQCQVLAHAVGRFGLTVLVPLHLHATVVDELHAAQSPHLLIDAQVLWGDKHTSAPSGGSRLQCLCNGNPGLNYTVLANSVR